MLELKPKSDIKPLYLHLLFKGYELQNTIPLTNQLNLEESVGLAKHLASNSGFHQIEFRRLGDFYDFQNNSLEITSHHNGIQCLEGTLGHGDRFQLDHLHFLVSNIRDIHTATIFHNSRANAWSRQLMRIPRIANSNQPVLILGPSGSGKEHLAQQICQFSKSHHKKLVSVNCSALTESLIESELFGHIKGAFTGAQMNRKGAFEEARGGTLFLDEIGDLPINLQPKLLRALENNEIRPVGSDSTIQTDVRIVAATHQNLARKVKRGEFREDLYFRLNVITLQPPPLKERICDFEDILFYFCKKEQISFDSLSLQDFKRHEWKGNIRELKNLIARAKALFGHHKVTRDQLEELIEIQPYSPPELDDFKFDEPIDGIRPTFDAIQKKLIIESLKKYQGNQRRTADALGMPKSTLHDRLKNYHINPKDFKVSSR